MDRVENVSGLAAPNERIEVIAKPQLLPILLGVTAITTVMVLLQAALAGQFLFQGNIGMIDTHGWIGNVFFLLVIVQAGLTFYALGVNARIGRIAVAVALGIVLLTVAQIGMGYAGRQSNVAASWHIPNGVLLFGLSSALLALLVTLGRPSRQV